MNTETLLSEIELTPDSTTNSSFISYSVYYRKTFVGSVSVSVLDTLYLKDLFIDKAYRRKGIGRYLINLLKINKLQCTTWNLNGIFFYESLGFKESHRDIYLVTFKR